MALLRTAAHDLGDGHAGDAQVRKRILKSGEPGLVEYHHYLGQLDIGGHRLCRWIMLHRNSFFNRDTGVRRPLLCLSHKYHWHEIRIGAGQIVFRHIQSLCLLLLTGPKADGMLQHIEGDDHGYAYPQDNADNT